MAKNVTEIVKEWLSANGFDGLCGEECGCGLDDLAPCVDKMDGCVPAYRVPCPPARDRKCSEIDTYLYRPEKPTGNACQGCPYSYDGE
jgi:hypothetical protein